jgi:hypothetical protein
MSDTATDPGLHPERCPLCGEDNDCQLLRGRSSCWCFEITMPQALKDRLQAEGKACACPQCATGRPSPQQVATRLDALVRRRAGRD